MKQLLTFPIVCLLCMSGSAQQRFISIEDTQIWINTLGIEDRATGQPVIVFESGHGTPMGNWDKVIARSEALGPIVTYDRPGVGQSESVDQMPTLKNVADRLIKILKKLQLEPPYLLVGHSLGGVYVRGFAIYYPEVLAGLIIIDPADFTETQQNKRAYYKVLGWDEQRIDQELKEQQRKDLQRNENIPLALQKERLVLSSLRQSNFQEINKTMLPNVPVHILTGGRFDMPQHMQSKTYDNEALFRSKMKHRVARWTDVIQSVNKGMIMYSGDAGHFVHWDDPELIVSSIKIALLDYAEIKNKKEVLPKKQ